MIHVILFKNDFKYFTIIQSKKDRFAVIKMKIEKGP